MPLVSAIIPTYNRAQVLERAIRSILNQTFRDFEMIIVDDGSTDDTWKVLDKFSSDAEILVRENKGVSAARNAGINCSSGELIAFLDSDDEWLPDKLKKQCEMFAHFKDDDFICHTDEIWLRKGKIVPQKKVHSKQGGRFFERALERCLISPSSVIISRNLLAGVGIFDENLPAAEDYDLWLRITAFHETHFIPEPLIIKHGGAANQLSETVPAIDRFRIHAIINILKNQQLSETYRKAAISELTRKCEIVAAGCIKKGKLEEAQKYRDLAKSYNGNCESF